MAVFYPNTSAARIMLVPSLMRPGRPVSIRVTATVSRGTFTLRVTNTLAAGHQPREGRIGLRNVRERMAIHFASRASFNAAPDGQGRWIAEIRMPCITDALEPIVATCAQPT